MATASLTPPAVLHEATEAFRQIMALAEIGKSLFSVDDTGTVSDYGALFSAIERYAGDMYCDLCEGKEAGNE
mgnify:CR=1 FL=1